MRPPLLLLPGLLAAAAAAAQPDDRLQRGGTFVEPPAQVDPAFTPAGPDRPAEGGAGEVLRLRLTLDIPLRSGTRAGSGTQGGPPGTPSVHAVLRWTPFEDRRWFVQGAFIRYLDGGRQRPWDPDFTYSFGFDDLRPGTLSVFYANYSGTRLRGHAGAASARANFAQGQWTVRRRFALPDGLQPLLLAGDGDDALCHADASVVPRYDLASGGQDRGKSSLALGCRYTRPDGWFAHLTGFAWPGAGQQPWDPDYSWGFGWSRGPWTAEYANYSGNRWPGRSRAPGEGRFDSGSLALSWSRSW